MDAGRRPPRSTGRAPGWLAERIRVGGRGLIALSGGVDSSVVAQIAHEALGPEALAVTLTGPAVSREETESARTVAGSIGIELLEVPIDPLVSGEYRANPSNRCYFCRQLEGAAFRAAGADRGILQYLDGLHVDDLGDDRPGIRAMDEAGFAHPLIEAGWTKSDVRAFAREKGLPNWDRPSNACLASRVPPGQPITAELLSQIGLAEALLQGWGFRRVRVRVRNDRALVVVAPEEVRRLDDPTRRSLLETELRRIGFSGCDVDPAGYAPRPGA